MIPIGSIVVFEPTSILRLYCSQPIISAHIIARLTSYLTKNNAIASFYVYDGIPVGEWVLPVPKNMTILYPNETELFIANPEYAI